MRLHSWRHRSARRNDRQRGDRRRAVSRTEPAVSSLGFSSTLLPCSTGTDARCLFYSGGEATGLILASK